MTTAIFERFIRALRTPVDHGFDADQEGGTTSDPTALTFFNGTPCMPWPGSVSPYGYAGQIKTGGTRKYPHRLIYENIIGKIPEGLTLDHLCRNRLCVNPYHMEPVTIAINVLRGIGPTARNARMTHCSKGHSLEGDNLYRWKYAKNLRVCKICRREVNKRACKKLRDKRLGLATK